MHFDFAVVDEAQDITVSHLRFLAALGGGTSQCTISLREISGNIFQQPFSWKSLGIERVSSSVRETMKARLGLLARQP